MITAPPAIDADDAAHQLGVSATVVLRLTIDGHLHARVDRHARGGFTVPVDQLTALEAATVDAARRYVDDL